jgi:alpha-tubulin suppressor-like RCC1 family protein
LRARTLSHTHTRSGTEASDFDPPAPVASLARVAFVTSIACGSHSTAVTDDVGDVYVWGRLLAAGACVLACSRARVVCVLKRVRHVHRHDCASVHTSTT